jgi:hypothetical protein
MAQHSAEETLKGLAGIACLGWLAYLYIGHHDALSTISTVSARLSGDPAANYTAPDEPIPPQQQRFTAIVGGFASRYRAAANDMVGGQLRHARAQALCAYTGGIPLVVESWIGRVETLSSDNAGDGVLLVAVGDGITIGTTNNSVSESLSDLKTLIPPDSDLARRAAALHVGEAVRFSGTFGASDADCLETADLTQQGAMTQPEFRLQFTGIAARD